MSVRALGRQFKAQWANRGNPHWLPGIKDHPDFAQGKLFRAGSVAKWKPSADVVEAGRRRVAGERNPDAPWHKGRIFQHHFQEYTDPSTGRVKKRVHEQGRLFE